MDYADKVFKFLEDAKCGSSYTISRICAKDNEQTFIALVKEYMDITPWQGGWVFSEDYTKLRRNQLPFETKKINRGLYNKQ